MVAQGWEQVYPEWDPQGIEDMVHWNGDTVFACGYNWTLQRSTDAGETWQALFSNNEDRSIKQIATDGKEIFFLAYFDRSIDTATAPVFAYDLSTGTVRDISVPLASATSYPTINDFRLIATTSFLYLADGYYKGCYFYRSSDQGITWETQALPQGVQIAQYIPVCFATDSIGYIIANGANPGQLSVYRTTDAGNSWNVVGREFPYAAFTERHISVPPNSNGDILWFANGLQVFLSEDRGTTWRETATVPWVGYFPGSVAIQVLSEDVAYICGSEGDVYKTTDGGENWLEVHPPSDLSTVGGVSDMCALDDNRALLSTLGGEWLRTLNGGITWTHEEKAVMRRIIDIHMFSKRDGIVFNAMEGEEIGLDIYLTTDAGDSWVRQGNTRDYFHNYRQYISIDELYVVYGFEDGLRESTGIYKSTDLGIHWETIQLWQPDHSPRGTFSAYERLFFIKDDDSIHYSYDAGETWEYNTITDTLNTASEIHFTYDISGKLVCYAPCFKQRGNILNNGTPSIFRSDDSGKTWQRAWVAPDSVIIIKELDVVSADTLFITTSELRGIYSYAFIYMSVDAGVTWSRLGQGVSGAQHEYFPPQVYSIGTSVMRILKTDDLWQTSSLQVDRKYFSYSPHVSFVDRDNGWICGNNVIYRTTNGGTSWTELPFTVRDDAAITAIYPNPVSAGQSTTIELNVGTQPFEAQGSRAVSLPHAMSVRIAVYDLLGREVAVLYSGPADPGTRTLTWRPAPTLPAGMYVVRMSYGDKVWAKQVVVVR